MINRSSRTGRPQPASQSRFGADSGKLKRSFKAVLEELLMKDGTKLNDVDFLPDSFDFRHNRATIAESGLENELHEALRGARRSGAFDGPDGKKNGAEALIRIIDEYAGVDLSVKSALKNFISSHANAPQTVTSPLAAQMQNMGIKKALTGEDGSVPILADGVVTSSEAKRLLQVANENGVFSKQEVNDIRKLLRDPETTIEPGARRTLEKATDWLWGGNPLADDSRVGRLAKSMMRDGYFTGTEANGLLSALTKDGGISRQDLHDIGKLLNKPDLKFDQYAREALRRAGGSRPTFRAGQSVYHDHYGPGRVLNATERLGRVDVSVDFDVGHSPRTIVSSFLSSSSPDTVARWKSRNLRR